MKKKTHVALTLALAVTLGVASFPNTPLEQQRVEAADFNYTQDQQKALNHLNALRAEMGLNPVKLNPFLNKAAQNHTNYLFTNGKQYGISGHTETKGTTGFTGIALKDRAEAVGLTGDLALGEGLAYGRPLTDSIDSLMYLPLHRVDMLDPNLVEVGVGYSQDGDTLGINSRTTFSFAYLFNSNEDSIAKEVTYPYDGQTNVGLYFDSSMESPNPLKDFGVDETGFAITYSPTFDLWIENVKFTLKDSKGTNLEGFTRDAFVGASHFFPKQKLKPNEKYTVTVSYKDQFSEATGGKTWSFTTTKTPLSGEPVATPTPAPKPTYADFQTGQYWSNDMLWAIDKGLIGGYINQKHPTDKRIKTKGNWLNPYGNLTVLQMQTVLTRYAKVANISNPKLPTATGASTVSRGQLAQALVSLHTGKSVTVQQAVQFMIDNNLTTQKSYASFNVGGQLKRAHIATFVKGYDTLKISGKQIIEPSAVQNTQTANPGTHKSERTSETISGLNIYYGNHTYGSKTQAEYDKVMSIVKQSIQNLSTKPWAGNPEYVPYYEAYLNGERGTRDRNSDQFYANSNSALLAAEMSLSVLDQAGLPDEEIKNIKRLDIILADLIGEFDAQAQRQANPSSAYDSIVRNTSDCDAYAQVQSAVFDAAGYNTMILATDSHAFAAIELNGKWYDMEVGFQQININEHMSNGWDIHISPTR